MNREIMLLIVRLIIMVLASVWTAYVVPLIKEKTNNETMQSVINWTVQAVLAAEQVHQASGDGPKRKQIVIDFIKKLLERKNIALSDEEIDVLIESAVKQMNAAKEAATHGEA